MIYVLYLVLAVGVVILSNLASIYVDLIDKKTSLSGAFIGGVMLSAVTSLPELFTSISATVMLNEPGLCIGNILGSNLFNVTILAILILIAFTSFGKANIAKSHISVCHAITLVYFVMFINMIHVLDFQILSVNITSIIIIILYIIGVKNMASENGEADEEEDDSPLTVKQIAIRFVLVSIGIIGLSIAITFVTDIISERLNLGTGLAGALFLGIATSLPEVSSTISLFKMKNHNIAIGNIIGSNLFNFVILAIVDIVYVGGTVYNYTDPKAVKLLIMGAIATPLMVILMKWKNKTTQLLCSLGVIACYVLFLVL